MVKTLTDVQKTELGLKYSRLITQTVSNNSELYQNFIPQWWKRFKGNWSSKKDPNYPYPGASDFNVPIITWICWSHISRFVDSLFGGVDVYKMIGTNPEAIKAAMKIQRYANSQFRRRDVYYKPIVEWLERLVVEGTAILMPIYEKVYKKRVKYTKNTIIEKGINALKYAVNILSGKMEVEGKQILMWEGVKVHNVRLEDFIYPVGTTNVEESNWVARRFFKYRRDIEQMGKHPDENKRWFDITKELLDSLPKVESKGEEDKDKQRDATNNDTIPTDIDKPYELFAVNCFEDLDESGEYNDYLLIITSTGKILWCDYNNDFDQKRRYTVTPLFRIAGMLAGQGFPERLALVSDEINTFDNLIVDNAVKSNCDIYTCKADKLASGLTPDKIVFRPGIVIPVKDHDALKRLDNTINQLDFKQRETFLMQIVERLGIINDTAMGRESEIERPTFRGKYLNLQEFMVNLGVLMEEIQMGLKELIVNVLELTYQNMPQKGISFRYSNQEGKIESEILTREDLEYLDDIDIFVTVSSQNAIKGVVEQKLMMLLEKLGGDQTGEVNTAVLKKALVDFIIPELSSQIMRDPKEIQQLQEMQDLLNQKAQILKHKEMTMMNPEAPTTENAVVPNEQAPIQEVQDTPTDQLPGVM